MNKIVVPENMSNVNKNEEKPNVSIDRKDILEIRIKELVKQFWGTYLFLNLLKVVVLNVVNTLI